MADLTIDEEILAYFENQPHADDSLEGLTQWWMRQPDGNREQRLARQQARAALDALVHAGFIQVVASTGGTKYKLGQRTRRRKP